MEVQNLFDFSQSTRSSVSSYSLFSTSGAQAASISYLSEFHSNTTRARSLTIVTMFIPLSVLYQCIVGWGIMTMQFQYTFFGFTYAPWRLYMLVTSLIMVLSFIMLLYPPESPKFVLAMGRSDEAVKILSKVYRANGCGKKQVCRRGSRISRRLNFHLHRTSPSKRSTPNL